MKAELERQIDNDKLGAERIVELRKAAQISLDEGRDPKHFDNEIYKSSFIEHPELKNEVSCVLSAMINNIERDSQVSRL